MSLKFTTLYSALFASMLLLVAGILPDVTTPALAQKPAEDDEPEHKAAETQAPEAETVQGQEQAAEGKIDSEDTDEAAAPDEMPTAEGMDEAGTDEEPEEESDEEEPDEESDGEEQDEESDFDEFEEEFEEEDLQAEAALEAQDTSRRRAPYPAGALGAQLGLYLRNDEVRTLYQAVPILMGWFSVADDVHIRLDWGFAYRGTSPNAGDPTNHMVVGNPSLFLRRILQEGLSEIHFGVGCALPASFLPDDDDPEFSAREAAYRTASGMRGRYDHWLWMPEHVGIVFRAGADMVSDSETRVFAGGEAALAVLIPSGDYRNDRASLYLQGSGEIGLGFLGSPDSRASKLVARLQLVSMPVAEDDRLQVSIGPAGRAELGSAFLDGSLMVNLDDPDGVFGSGRDIWGLHLGGGMSF